MSCVEGNAVATTSGKAGGKEKATHADFMTEYAKSGGSTCRGCDEKIAKVCYIYMYTLPWCFICCLVASCLLLLGWSSYCK